jgi:hypothetical protein
VSVSVGAAATRRRFPSPAGTISRNATVRDVVTPGRSFFNFQSTISEAASGEAGTCSKSIGRIRAHASGKTTDARARRSSARRRAAVTASESASRVKRGVPEAPAPSDPDG